MKDPLHDLEIEPGWFVDRKALSLGAPLGSGSFGAVVKCQVEGWTTQEVVAKRIQPQRLKPADAMLLKHEIALWVLLDHPNTVRFLGLATDPSECCLLCEFCEGGTLESVHEKVRAGLVLRASESQSLEQMHQIASGMAHVHALGFMHRDLKPSNILVHGPVLKVGDFGLACARPTTDKAKLTAETGSYRWMAPEVMRHEAYNESCDVYSFGLVAWQLATVEVPFANMLPVQAAFAVADQAARPKIPPTCNARLAALLPAWWHPALEKRPSFEAVVCSLAEMRGPPPLTNRTAAPIEAPATAAEVSASETMVRARSFEESLCSEPGTPITVSLSHADSRSNTPTNEYSPARHVQPTFLAVPARPAEPPIRAPTGVAASSAPVAIPGANAPGSGLVGNVCLGTSLFDLGPQTDSSPREGWGSHSPGSRSPASDGRGSGSGRSEAFGTDPSSPKGERKRVLLDHDGFELEYSSAKIGTSGSTEPSSAPPGSLIGADDPTRVMQREMSISSGLKTLLTVQVAEQPKAP